jgi:hypothetical protein
MALAPYYNDLAIDSNGVRYMTPTKWNEMMDNFINWKFHVNAGGNNLSNVGTLQAVTLTVSGALSASSLTMSGLLTGTSGAKLTVTNPTVSTSDYSFATSTKGLAVDTIINASGALGCGIVGQVDVTSSAPTTGSAQGVRGDIRVSNAAEVYGVFGYVDWQHSGAHGAGGIFATRGLVADATKNGIIDGLYVVGEGDFPAATGIRVASSGSGNKFHYGLRIQSAIDSAIFIDDMGTGGAIPFTCVHLNTVSPESYTALFLDRTFADVGDSMDIVFGGAGTGVNSGDRAARIAARVAAPGVMGISLYAQNGGDGYSQNLIDFIGGGRIRGYIPTSSAGLTSGEWYHDTATNTIKVVP